MAPLTSLPLGHISQAELTGYWYLDESTGTRVPTLGNSVYNSAGYKGPNLTENGTVGRVARGPSGAYWGADFQNNAANYLSGGSLSLSTSKGLWISARVRIDASRKQCICSSYNNSSNGRFILRVTATNTVEFLMLNSAGTLVGIESAATLTVGTEYTIQAWAEERDASPGVFDTVLRINGDLEEVGATITAPWGLGTSTFMVGRVQTSGAEEPFDGMIAELRIANRAPTITEKGLLYRIHESREHVHLAIPTAPSNVRGRFMRGAPLQWGIALSEDAGTNIVTRERVDRESKAYGNKFNVYEFYRSAPKPAVPHPFDDSWPFREQGFKASLSSGAIPMLTLEFFYYAEGTGTLTFISMEEMTRGTYDEFLLYYCERLRAIKGPKILRIFHEMDLRTSYNWAESDPANDDSVTPPRLLTMWKYVVRFIREELSEGGSTDYEDVWFQWCPNRNPVPQLGTAPWNDINNYWPGRDWVDMVGTDGYDSPGGFSFPQYNPTPISFLEAQEPNFTKIKALVNIHEVPFVVSECNTRGRTESEWQDWVENASRQAIREGIAGIILFDVPSKQWEVYDNILSTYDIYYKPNYRIGVIE